MYINTNYPDSTVPRGPLGTRALSLCLACDSDFSQNSFQRATLQLQDDVIAGGILALHVLECFRVFFTVLGAWH